MVRNKRCVSIYLDSENYKLVKKFASRNELTISRLFSQELVKLVKKIKKLNKKENENV